MVGRSGITAYRVSTVKRGLRTHVAVDGGMGDNLEVALYGQAFEPAVLDKNGATAAVDVVGRFCESGDWLARDAPLVDPRVGDIITVPATGAYCHTLANNYNAALRPPVVFCENGAARLAVRRETYTDLLQRDVDLERVWRTRRLGDLFGAVPKEFSAFRLGRCAASLNDRNELRALAQRQGEVIARPRSTTA